MYFLFLTFKNYTFMNPRVTFGASCAFAPGNGGYLHPAVSMNNSIIVAAYLGSGNKVYTVSSLINGPSMDFAHSANAGTSVLNGCPSIAINSNNTVAVVFLVNSNQLYYRIGSSNGNGPISWGSLGYRIPNISAQSCSVAMNNNVIVIAYQDLSNKLHYLTGSIMTDQSIIWFSGNYDSGQKPSVALNNAGYFVEVHQSENHDSLYYNVGKLNSSGAISILYQHEYKGRSQKTPSITPAVAMNDLGQVLEVHGTGKAGDDSLYYMQYQLNTSTHHLDFVCEQLYSLDSTTNGMGGSFPSVALNYNGDAVQLYQTTSKAQFYGCMSKIWDRSNWMQGFQSKTLSQLSIPGSHDAAMSDSSDCLAASSGNTKTQVKRIAHQLDVGIRYFDIRPVFVILPTGTVNEFRTGHFSGGLGGVAGCFGEDLSDILKGVKSFLQAHTSETVILKFSHFLSFLTQGTAYFYDSVMLSTSTKQSQINQLITYIGQYLPSSLMFTNSSAQRLADVPLSSCAGKAIIVLDIADLSEVTFSAPIYSYLDYNPSSPNKNSADLVVFDKYSNTNDINVMISKTVPTDPDHPGQEYQLMNASCHGGDLFLLSWTLTLKGLQVVNPAGYDILQLSQLANGILANEMTSMKTNNLLTAVDFPNVIYVDAADGFATDVCVWINNQHLR